MNSLGIQLIVVPFAIFMLYVSFIHYKKGHILKESLLFWTLLWALFILFAFFPQLLDPISKKLHFFRTLDFLMVVAFMILAVMNYNNYLSQQKIERELEKLIEKMIIVKEKKKSKHNGQKRSKK